MPNVATYDAMIESTASAGGNDDGDDDVAVAVEETDETRVAVGSTSRRTRTQSTSAQNPVAVPLAGSAHVRGRATAPRHCARIDVRGGVSHVVRVARSSGSGR